MCEVRPTTRRKRKPQRMKGKRKRGRKRLLPHQTNKEKDEIGGEERRKEGIKEASALDETIKGREK